MGDAIDKGITKDDLADKLKEQFKDMGNKGDTYWQGLAEHTGLRMREFGRIAGYRKGGFTHYRLRIILDERTSQICRALAAENKIYELAPVYKIMDSLERMNTGASLETARTRIKELAPWINDKDVVYNDKAEPVGLKGNIVPFPPLHWKCRTETEVIA